ncbi:MAG: hypothetical protein GC136_07160 [Alphaproteobacteria bacterium]|nr:hypothetical protein [Alphaproteobacteria bacterium]
MKQISLKQAVAALPALGMAWAAPAVAFAQEAEAPQSNPMYAVMNGNFPACRVAVVYAFDRAAQNREQAIAALDRVQHLLEAGADEGMYNAMVALTVTGTTAETACSDIAAQNTTVNEILAEGVRPYFDRAVAIDPEFATIGFTGVYAVLVENNQATLPNGNTLDLSPNP